MRFNEVLEAFHQDYLRTTSDFSFCFSIQTIGFNP